MRVFLLHRFFLILFRRYQFVAAGLLVSLLFSSPANAAKVLIVGDIQYALVADVAAEIKLSVRSQVAEYTTSAIRGRLGAIAENEGAQVVVALGVEALGEAMRLPSSIAVVYGLVIVPPRGGRTNVTGVYMSPPVSEYVSAIRRFLPGINRISVLGSQEMIKSLTAGDSAHVSVHHVGSSADLVNAVLRINDSGAFLLLPDANLLTAQSMSSVYLHSFRKNIPVLGISEANVRQGSLFAFVFEPKTVSRQIGEMVQTILNGSEAMEIPASPPGRYNLFINSNTARKMGINLPDGMLKKAKKVY